MKPGAFAATLLLTFVAMGGCSADPTPPVDSRTADSTMLDGSAAATSQGSGSPAKTPGGVRAIPIKGIYNEAAVAGSGMCGPPFTVAEACEEYVAEHVNFTGTLNGNAMGIEHSGAGAITPDRQYFEKYPFIYTGSIADCGTGMLAFRVTGWFYRSLDGVHANETIRMVPGSQSLGLADVVDVVAYLDVLLGPSALRIPITGTVWCR